MSAPARPILKPCLAELLRTCAHPPSLILRIEHVFGKAQRGSHGNAAGSLQEKIDTGEGGVSDNETYQKVRREQDSHAEYPAFTRLALSDGHLQIQAIFANYLHTKHEFRHLSTGDALEVHKFEVRSAPRLNGKGCVIYLFVTDCEIVAGGVNRVSHAQGEELQEAGGFLREEPTIDMSPSKKPSRELAEQQPVKGEYTSWSRKRDRKQAPEGSGKPTALQTKAHAVKEDDSESDDGGFDTLAVSQSQVEERRETLRTIQTSQPVERNPKSRLRSLEEYSQAETQRSLPPSPRRRPTRDQQVNDSKQDKEESDELSKNHTTTPALPNLPEPGEARSQVRPLTPPPPLPAPPPSITSLAALLATPIQKPHHCPPLFALISWVSPSILHRANSPFPPKRHLKIHDPSISSRHSGVSVAVFIDAARFLPAVGTLALMTGLIMNRVRSEDQVILNRYPLKTGSQAGQKAGLEEEERDREEEDWFISDEDRLIEMGYDVQGMKKWWEERSAARKEKSK